MRKIHQGIYLVVDPAIKMEELTQKLSGLPEEEIAAIQVWDNFSHITDVEEIIAEISAICLRKKIPCLVNNRVSIARKMNLQGIHFDDIPTDNQLIKALKNEGFVLGITCNNDLSVVAKATEMGFHYISFCAVFPSGTSNSCELVKEDSIIDARKMTSIPIFLSGGINLDTLPKLRGLEFDGIAVVSGIMGDEDPRGRVFEYKKQLNQIIQ